MKFAFIDKEQLCVYDNGKKETYESAYITRYRENQQREQKNREWKKQSDVMLYDDFYGGEREDIISRIHAISPTLEDNRIIYAFSVNQTSGVYYKYINDEKNTEAHLISSNEENFETITINSDGQIAGSVQKDMYTSNIAIFSAEGGDYKCITGGDSKDENPFFGKDGEIWFNSYGVGRTMQNEFVKYVPSEVLKINVHTMEIVTMLSDSRYSFIKPMTDKEGNLYCIKKPGEEKEKHSIFLDILLIPVRIIQAIIGFISMFVTIFAGKPLVEGKGKVRNGFGAAKNADEKKIFIHNHLLNVEEEMKKNKKSEESGFIPRSWKLVKIPFTNDDFSGSAYKTEQAEELASGVADYFVTEENGENVFVYTNGKRIFELRGKEKIKKKLLHTDFCIKLGAVQVKNDKDKTAKKTDLFNML